MKMGLATRSAQLEAVFTSSQGELDGREEMGRQPESYERHSLVRERHAEYSPHLLTEAIPRTNVNTRTRRFGATRSYLPVLHRNIRALLGDAWSIHA